MRSQTATEYLIIVAVVIIIALVVVGALGGIPGIGGSTNEATARAFLQSQDVGVLEYAVSVDEATLNVRNNQQQTVRINNVTVGGKGCQVCGGKNIAPGRQAQLKCSVDTLNAADDFDGALVINYTDVKTAANFSLAEKDGRIIGKVASSNFIDPVGTQVWNVTFGDANTNGFYGVSVDNCGNPLLIGFMSNPIVPTDAHTKKLNSDGTQQWSASFDLSGFDYGKDIDNDYLGNSIILGSTSSIGAGDMDALFIKYGPDGVKLWNTTWGGGSAENGYGITVDDLGNIYGAANTYSFGAGGTDAAVVKLSSDGSQLWNATWGGSGIDLGYGVATDSNYNVFLIGYTQSFGAGGSDMFLAKFNSAGSQVWNATWGGSNNEIAYAVVTDNTGNIYVAGYTQSFGAGSADIILIKYSSSGSQIWNATWGGSGVEHGNSVAIDGNGNLYVAGYTSSFGSGGNDMALVRFLSNGSQSWNATWGGGSGDTGDGVAIDSAGNVYVAGGTQSFGAGGRDMYVAKYS